jgi:CheY-like chemotaxis protein
MSDAPPAALQGLRVLIVEDEALVSMLLEDMLSDLGCEIAAVCSRVDQAVAAASDTSQRIDVAILDVNVAGQPVTPVAEALAARGAPFVFATGYGAGGAPEAFRDRPTLQKPFGMTDVETRLREAAGR